MVRRADNNTNITEYSPWQGIFDAILSSDSMIKSSTRIWIFSTQFRPPLSFVLGDEHKMTLMKSERYF